LNVFEKHFIYYYNLKGIFEKCAAMNGVCLHKLVIVIQDQSCIMQEMFKVKHAHTFCTSDKLCYRKYGKDAHFVTSPMVT